MKVVAVLRGMERCGKSQRMAQKLKRTKGNISVHTCGASIKKKEGSELFRL